MTGYKVLKIKVKSDNVFCDLALFGEKSPIIDGVQVAHKIIQDIPYENRQEYGNELKHNFINDLVIFKGECYAR